VNCTTSGNFKIWVVVSNLWCSSVVPYSAIFLPVGSHLIFGAWHAVLCPLADTSLVTPHSTLTLIYRSGYPARLHLGSPWRLFCGVPTASHPHPWLVPYLDRTETRDLCLLVVPQCPLTQVVSI